jgi:hypothetical protein
VMFGLGLVNSVWIHRKALRRYFASRYSPGATFT